MGPAQSPRALPPHAQARLDRFAGSHVRTSLLSVPAAVSLESVGFEPIGEVMGATVQQSSRWTLPGAAPYSQADRRTVRLSSHPWSPYRRQVELLDRGWATVLRRMVDEARSLDADGIVGVELHRDVVEEVLVEFIGTGTAVRARGAARPARPFTTALGGADVAALMINGWVPVQLQRTVEIGIRWGDYSSIQQQRGGRYGVNVEVDSLTQVVNRTREGARARLRAGLSRAGGDGGLLHALTMTTWHEQGWVAEVTATGTAIARFADGRFEAPRPLMIMTLGRAR